MFEFYFRVEADGAFPRVNFSCPVCGNRSFQMDHALFPEVTIPQFLVRVFETHERQHAEKAQGRR